MKERFIAPTLIDQVEPDFPVMQEEIFGPILPVISFDDIREVIPFVLNREKPLAFYYFVKSGKERKALEQTTSGGACINDTIMYIANHHLPFRYPPFRFFSLIKRVQYKNIKDLGRRNIPDPWNSTGGDTCGF